MGAIFHFRRQGIFAGRVFTSNFLKRFQDALKIRRMFLSSSFLFCRISMPVFLDIFPTGRKLRANSKKGGKHGSFKKNQRQDEKD